MGLISTSSLVPSKTNILSATTTLVKTGAGQLHKIVVGTHATGTIKLYDGLTAVNIFANIASTDSAAPISLAFDCQFSTGLTVVTSSSVDITVVYE